MHIFYLSLFNGLEVFLYQILNTGVHLNLGNFRYLPDAI